MDKNKQDRSKSSDSDSATTLTAPSIKPLPETGKPARVNTDKRDKSNDQFPSAL